MIKRLRLFQLTSFLICLASFAKAETYISKSVMLSSNPVQFIQGNTTNYWLWVGSGTLTSIQSSSTTIYNVLHIGDSAPGKPDALLTLVSDGVTDPSRQGIGIDVTNNLQSRIPILVVTNKSNPTLAVGSALAFYQQLPGSGADVQQGAIAFSQDSTTHTARLEFFVRSSSNSNPNRESNSIQAVAMYGIEAGTNENMLGYAFTMFGPTGAESAASTAYGAYTPGSIVHVASDFGDSRDGIRLERRRDPNAYRYGLRINSSGALILDTVGDYVDDPILEIIGETGQINLKGALSSTRQIIYKGTDIAEDLGEGYVSQHVSSSSIGFLPMTSTAAFENVCSVAISSGDWDFVGIVVSTTNTSTIAWWDIALSTFSGATTTDHVLGVNWIPARPAVNASPESLVIPRTRILTGVNTTVYIKVSMSYSGATPRVRGSVRGRRVH